MRLEKARGLARKREQLVEAHKVRVVLAERSVTLPDCQEPVNQFGDAVGTTCGLVAVVVNRGAYTITNLECMFSLAGRSGSVAPPADRQDCAGDGSF